MRIEAPEYVTLNNLLYKVISPKFSNIRDIIYHRKLSGKFSDHLARNFYSPSISGKIEYSESHDMLKKMFSYLMRDDYPNRYHLNKNGYYFHADHLAEAIELTEDDNEPLSNYF